MQPTSPDFPAHWTPAARDVVAEVLDVRPDLSGADLASLREAAELVTAADELAEVARTAGHVATGSRGQPITHPATVEARLSRQAAASILARLAAPSSGASMTNTERARQAARARWAK